MPFSWVRWMIGTGGWLGWGQLACRARLTCHLGILRLIRRGLERSPQNLSHHAVKRHVQVTDSLSLRRFCRIGLETSVPDESTMRGFTRPAGP